MSYNDCRHTLQQALQGCGRQASVVFRVLFHARKSPLLLAENSLGRLADVLAWFGRHPLLSMAARLQMALPLPERLQIPCDVFSALPLAVLLAGRPGRVIAMQCGTHGPLQKVSLLLELEETGELVMTKLALGEQADEVVLAEAAWLTKLAASPELHCGIPSLLTHGRLPGTNRAFLTTTACSALAARGKTRMDERHRDFLLELARFTRIDGHWANSDCELRTRHRLANVPGIRPAERRLLEQVLECSSQLIGTGVFPNVLTHGDFAPWNVHVLPDKAYVFDWEYAEERGNPLADFFHFNLMPYATKGKLPATAMLGSLLDSATAHLGKIDGIADVGVQVSQGMLLHYLADTVLFYAEKSGYLGVSHPVIATYLRLMSQAKDWVGCND